MLRIRIIIGIREIDNTVEINNKIGGIIIIEIEIIIIEEIIKIEEIKIIEIILKVDIIRKQKRIKRMISIKIDLDPDKEIINIQEDEYDKTNILNNDFYFKFVTESIYMTLKFNLIKKYFLKTNFGSIYILNLYNSIKY